jgi:hypothetical protein
MTKIEAFWENATAEDVARVMEGETVEARFWDDEHRGKAVGWLVGWGSGEPCWYCEQTGGRSYFENCQVYREPSWWTERPDPGPGWRLLGKFPDEEPKPGDEAWDMWNDKQWAESENANGGKPQSEEMWYRRRIEPVEPKFSVGQTVRVIGPKATDARQWSKKMNEHVGEESPIKAREKKGAGWFYELGCSATWAFREDYLEAVEVGLGHYALRVGDSASLPNGQTITITEKGFEVAQ